MSNKAYTAYISLKDLLTFIHKEEVRLYSCHCIPCEEHISILKGLREKIDSDTLPIWFLQPIGELWNKRHDVVTEKLNIVSNNDCPF